MYSDHHGLELLSQEECVQLLRTKTVGRVGLSASSLPFVLPVRYVVDDDRILMRTGESTRMAAATSDAVVAFEVDEFDADMDAGWSVMVQGFAREVRGGVQRRPGCGGDPEQLGRPDARPLLLDPDGDRDRSTPEPCGATLLGEGTARSSRPAGHRPPRSVRLGA